MEVLAEYLVHIAVSVLRRWSRWSILIWASVPLVLRLMIQVWVCCLMGDFLRRIRGYRAVRFQGMAF
jgi:hypothetical protein